MFSSIFKLYKQSFQGLRLEVWLLSLITLINRSGTMVVPFMSMYMTQTLHVSLTKAGFVLTCFGMGAIIGALLGGKLTDKLGHYKVQLGTLILGGISFMVLGQLKEYHWICIMTFILALFNEAFRPANMSAIGLYSTPENRARSSSLVRLATNLGWALGATLGGILASINYELLFWVDGTTNLISAFFLYTFIRPKSSTLGHISVPKLKEDSALKDKNFILFVILSFFFAICFFQIFSTYPVYLKKYLLLVEHQIGWIFALNGLLIALFEMVIISSLIGKRNELSYIFLGLILTGISFLILNITFENALIISVMSCVFFTAGEIFAMPFMMSFWMNRTNDSNRGQYASLYTVAYSAAHILGPLIGGYIADQYGFYYLWLGVFIFCIITGIGFLSLKKNIRTQV